MVCLESCRLGHPPACLPACRPAGLPARGTEELGSWGAKSDGGWPRFSLEQGSRLAWAAGKPLKTASTSKSES